MKPKKMLTLDSIALMGPEMLKAPEGSNWLMESELLKTAEESNSFKHSEIISF